MPYKPDPGPGADEEKLLDFQASREVRHTVIRVITAHLQDGAAISWQGLNFDFTGADFDGGSFAQARFPGGTVCFNETKFSGGTVRFNHAKFSGGAVNFYLASFSRGEVKFDDAEFSGSRVSFDTVTFGGGDVSFAGAEFSGGDIDFDYSEFHSGDIDFSYVKFSAAESAFKTLCSSAAEPAFMVPSSGWSAAWDGLQAGDGGGDVRGPGPAFGEAEPQPAVAAGDAACDGEEPTPRPALRLRPQAESHPDNASLAVARPGDRTRPVKPLYLRSGVDRAAVRRGMSESGS